MVQALECLLCKSEALSSNPSPTKKRQICQKLRLYLLGNKGVGVEKRFEGQAE
jgi:hypothetical protein